MSTNSAIFSCEEIGRRCVTFSLGFGPKLIGKKVGETQYQIAAVPLGGFVKLIGEDPEEEVKEEDRPLVLFCQPIWKRALIIGAGPFFNFFLACSSSSLSLQPLLAFLTPSLSPEDGGISPGLPAEKAGLKKGRCRSFHRWGGHLNMGRHFKNHPKEQGKELSMK